MDGEGLMRKVAAAMEMSDLRPLFEAIDDDIVWKSGATTTGSFRFGGVYKRRAGVVQLTSQISAAYVFRRLQPQEIVTRGNVVWGVFDVEGDYQPWVGRVEIFKPVKFQLAVRWRLRRGKIIEHQGFFDTHSLLQQQLH